MPELPEVETIVRALGPHLVGRRIKRVTLRQPRILIGDVTGARGFSITGVQRWGKHIVLDLRRRASTAHLLIHLGMTGQLLLDGEPGPHTHAFFYLDGGRLLLYNDIRQFGRMELTRELPVRLRRLGPDPFQVTEAEFVALFRARSSMAKPLLLNQLFLRGLGNIYADEALFRARIHPRTISARVRPAKAAALYRAIIKVLTEAIEDGGSSISDYVSSDGSLGYFQFRHQVYQRTGSPCPVCSAAIRRIVVASRGTHFCPRCQR